MFINYMKKIHSTVFDNIALYICDVAIYNCIKFCGFLFILQQSDNIGPSIDYTNLKYNRSEDALFFQAMQLFFFLNVISDIRAPSIIR